ncbi:MAG: sigma-70 family RNA polymerase sigma factor [Planctomycetota bacterium]|nr:sigma-70 family RNA polymerase sigma factor [Planctomycetota bacterium]
MIEEHIGLCSWIANRYLYTGREFEELRSTAYLGLIAAAERWDPSRGAFATAFFWWARAAIQRDLASKRSRFSTMQGHREGPRTVSLDAPLGRDDDSTSLASTLGDDNAEAPADGAERALLRERIESALVTLRPRDAEVLRLRFGLDGGGPRTLEEVARHFSRTRERIRQIEKRAMRKLRYRLAGLDE